MDFEKYEHHFNLLSYRGENAKDRLAVLRADIHQPMGTLCGFAELLQLYISKKECVPCSIVDFQMLVKSICVSIQQLRERTQYDKETLTQEIAQEALLTFWQKYDVVHTALSLPSKMQTLENELRAVMPDFEFWLKVITDRTLLLWAEFDVLANPDKMDLPEAYVQFYEKLEELLIQIRAGNIIGLEQFIDASRHEASYFRHTASVVLGHFTDERATDALISLLFDEVDEVRGWAALSLKNANSEKVISALAQALQQDFKNKTYIGWIADALAHLKDAPCVRL